MHSLPRSSVHIKCPSLTWNKLGNRVVECAVAILVNLHLTSVPIPNGLVTLRAMEAGVQVQVHFSSSIDFCKGHPPPYRATTLAICERSSLSCVAGTSIPLFSRYCTSLICCDSCEAVATLAPSPHHFHILDEATETRNGSSSAFLFRRLHCHQGYPCFTILNRGHALHSKSSLAWSFSHGSLIWLLHNCGRRKYRPGQALPLDSNVCSDCCTQFVNQHLRAT